ncbi:HU family DNA-binding protein [Acidimangrovimonas sediminis]|uniref:HU family DNA-binding protein n=1 Tax=Acidimangrovimonas sediminis TaxID=2056283 RepID=UPI000C802D99|nr:HU family DNA-binding protein [Acidimangrovimonas sediminis]
MATTPRKSKSKSPAGRATPGSGRRKAAERPSNAKPRLAAVEGAGILPADPAGTAAEPVSAEATLGKKELFQRVTAATGAKKKDARLIAEATLAILGQALSEGEELNLPPLGKMRIVRSRDGGGAEVFTLKLRRKTGVGSAQPVTAAASGPGDDDASDGTGYGAPQIDDEES